MTRSLKTLALIAVMALMLFMSAAAIVSAESDEDFENAIVIKEDEDIQLPDNVPKDKRVAYKFTPAESGLYTLDLYDTNSSFTVWIKDGDSYKYVETESYMFTTETFQDRIKKEMIAGTDYFFTIYLSDPKYTGYFRLFKEDITGISVTPKKPIVFEEYVDGAWLASGDYNGLENDLKRNHFTYYPRFQNGDKLTINYGSGKSEEYIFDDEHELFKCGKRFCSPMIFYLEDFKLGENRATVELEGRYTCDVPVKVVKSSVKSFSFKFTTPLRCTDNGIYYEKGDTVIVKTSSGTRSYKWSPRDAAFIGDDRHISDWCFKVSISPLKIGANNKITFSYGGKKYTTPIIYHKKGTKVKSPMSVKVKDVSLKYSSLKKASKTYKADSVFKLTYAVGKVRYKTVKSDSKAKSKITVSSNGTLKIAKGLKKGKYTVKVKVSDKGNKVFTGTSKTVKLNVAVK